MDERFNGTVNIARQTCTQEKCDLKNSNVSHGLYVQLSSKSSTHYLNDTLRFKLQYVASVGSG